MHNKNASLCWLIEGEFHYIQYKSSQPHFMKEGDCLSWGWSAQ